MKKIPMPLCGVIEAEVRKVFKDRVGYNLGKIIRSHRPELGQFQCNEAFEAAKILHLSPMELAETLAEQLRVSPLFSDVSVSPPGFLNFTVFDQVLLDCANALLQDERCGVLLKQPSETIILDFGGVNIAKAMHVGHMRSAMIGEALQRLMRFLGDTVIGDIHMGDWGLPMGMLIEEFKRLHPEWPYFKENYVPGTGEPTVLLSELEAIYPKAAERCKFEIDFHQAARQTTTLLQQGHPGYRALWQKMKAVSLEDIRFQFSRLGIHFDLWLGESDVNDRIDSLLTQLKEKGIAQMSAGALVIPSLRLSGKSEGQDFVLLTSDGSLTYALTDLATIEDRMQKYSPQRMWYVVDKRQSTHFDQVFRAAKISGMADHVTLEHIGFGTINGKDNRPFKTRSGDTMKLGALLDMAEEKARQRIAESKFLEVSEHDLQTVASQIAISAIKFADLSHDRLSDYICNLDEFLNFQGCTGPYLLYTTVRIRSLLAKAKQEGLTSGAIVKLQDTDRHLLLQLFELTPAVYASYEKRSLHHLCEYAYQVSKDFNVFYESCRILEEVDKTKSAQWLSLCELTLKVLEKVLDLLGIAIPEKM